MKTLEVDCDHRGAGIRWCRECPPAVRAEKAEAELERERADAAFARKEWRARIDEVLALQAQEAAMRAVVQAGLSGCRCPFAEPCGKCFPCVANAALASDAGRDFVPLAEHQQERYRLVKDLRTNGWLGPDERAALVDRVVEACAGAVDELAVNEEVRLAGILRRAGYADDEVEAPSVRAAAKAIRALDRAALLGEAKPTFPRCADCGTSLNAREAKCFTVCGSCWGKP